MATMTNRPRLTSAQFLSAHRRALETISDLFAAVEGMPVLAAADPTTMKHFFDELADVQATTSQRARRSSSRALNACRVKLVRGEDARRSPPKAT